MDRCIAVELVQLQLRDVPSRAHTIHVQNTSAQEGTIICCTICQGIQASKDMKESYGLETFTKETNSKKNLSKMNVGGTLLLNNGMDKKARITKN